MKKLSMFVLAALALVSCGKKCDAKDFIVDIASENDSLNYAFGYYNGSMIKQQLLKDSVDEPAIYEFFEALEASYTATEEEPTSELFSLQIASMMNMFLEQGLAQNPAWTFQPELFQQGLINSLNEDTVAFSPAKAEQYLQTAYMASMGAEKETAEKNDAKISKFKNKVKEVELKTQNDSLNYAFGVMMGGQLLNEFTVEEEQDELIDAVNKAIKRDNPQMIMAAKQIAQGIKQQDTLGLLGVADAKTEYKMIKYGIFNGLYGVDSIMDQTKADQILRNFTMKAQEEQMKAMQQEQAALGEKMKAEGEAYLAENAKKAGVKVTASGLQYEVLTMGNGPKPTAESTVKVHYEGKLIDGTIFDSSIQRGEPISFPLSGVIKGWTEGVQLMPVGSKFRFTIPYDLAYGEYGASTIPPFATLIFEVELLDIEK